MRVIALKFENYRNLKDNIITPCENVNVIYGDNAQGKTNLLEALWLFCGGHSFRGTKDSEVINFDKNFAKIETRFFGQEREQTAKITFHSNKKSVEINGVDKKSSASLIEKYCAVVFSPDHLNLIKRGPSQRRKFIDSAICREKLRNAVILSKYNKVLNQRNSLLKNIVRNPSLEKTLNVWDEPLISNGTYLIKARIEYIKLLSKYAENYHLGISEGKEKLSVNYISSCGINDSFSLDEIKYALTEKIENNRKEDIKSGFTNFGPHRDDMDILINDRSTKLYASQGQQRSAVLSLKLSEASILKEKMGEEPIILLDDVMSELDLKRQNFLLNKLDNCQVFITCCEKSNKEQLKNGKVFNICNGEIIWCIFILVKTQ